MSDEFPHYLKIYNVGHDDVKNVLEPETNIIVEEKIDGANFRFFIKDKKIFFGSHYGTLGWSDQTIGGDWKRCIEYVKKQMAEFMKNQSQWLTDESLIFYGECCIKHSIMYDYDRMPPFLGFDIYNLNEQEYLDYDRKVKIFKWLDLPIVPLLFRGKSDEWKMTEDDSDIPQSTYYNGICEGYVIKNQDNGIYAKKVATKFREINREVFGGSKKHAQNDTEKILLTYCTNPRIDKAIFELINTGEKLDLPLMHKLPEMVYRDMIEENWREMVFSRFVIDFGLLKRMVSKRCLEILKRVMINNALNNMSGGQHY